MKVLSLIRKSRWSCAALVAALIPSVSLVTIPVQANPAGATVIHGNIDIQGIGTGNVNINQASKNAIINWQDFSINAGETTHFNQVAGGVILNRVVGVNPSSIYGTLSATGTVFVVNPNGILVGSSGVIDVGGALTLSTLDLSNADFLNGGANRFYGGGVTGIVNRGTIRAANGDVMFLGGFAHNFNSIEATRGAVALAAGGEMIVGQSGDATISIVSGSSYDGIGVNQAGTVTGAATELQSHGNAFALAINNGGITRATGGYRKNGRSVLRAMGSSRNITNTGTIAARNQSGSGGEVRVEGGRIENSGTIDASGINAGGGGSIDVIGDSLYFDDNSVVTASSMTGGGSVNLDADGTAEINGSIDVSSMLQSGGEATITATDVIVNAVIDATGETSGGTIKAGGDFQGIGANGLRASDTSVIGQDAYFDATARTGNAGEIIVWSDGDTIFEGEARANATGLVGNGGLIEVSGKENLTFRGLVSATSANGNAGTVLFDPGTLTVGNGFTGVNQLSNQTINDLLQGGTSVLLATQGEDSDIVFQNTGIDDDRHDAIQWTNSDASFGAFAGGNVIVNSHIRTSGAGSINLIAGWTGTEAEALGFLNGTISSPDGSAPSSTIGGTGAMSVQDIFNYYVSNGQFGDNNGIISIGSATENRDTVVGSRFGDTSVAGASVLVTGSNANSESRFTQLGFRDSGTIFSPRRGTLDLNDGALAADNNVITGVAGVFEVDVNGNQLTDVFGNRLATAPAPNEATGDGIAVGVYAIDVNGVHNDTLIPYANHYTSARQGNWWWQRIDAAAPDPGGLGGLRPEMGAGTAANTADINIIATQNVVVQGGGRHQSGAYVGHGGDAAGWADDRSLQSGGDQNGQTPTGRKWSYNGATNDRVAHSIARLAPVYGNINVLSGVDASAGINFSGDTVTATILDGVGSVLVQGIQSPGASNDPSNINNNNASAGAPAVIGHGGIGQFGEFNGDIQVRTGGSVLVRSGSNSRGFAQIGHNIDTYHYWDPPSNANAQIRFFSSDQDMRDPRLRRAELYTGNTNILFFTDAEADASGQTNANLQDGAARALSDPQVGPIGIEALDGSVVTGFHGDITVEAGAGNVEVLGYNTPTASTNNRDRRYARIGHGGTSATVWAEESGYDILRTDRDREYVEFRMPNNGDESGSRSIVGETGAGRNRALTFMTITGDVSVNSGGDVIVKAGNDTFDFAQIGHGGQEIADYETSSFIAGQIDVTAQGGLIVQGGGEVEWGGLGDGNNNNANYGNRHHRSQAQIGHGGYSTGFLGYVGDININVVRDIAIIGGAYGDNYAKIGHNGAESWGQVGGNFLRTENFFFDSVSTDVVSSINGTTGTVTYSGDADGLSGGFSSGGVGSRTFELTSNTANINVNSVAGGITLDHLDAGPRQNANQALQPNNGAGFVRESENLGQREDAYAQIGHGGNLSGQEYWRNVGTNFDDIVGDVNVTASGNITLNGGDHEGFYSRIGHGFGGENVRVRHGESLNISGSINVTSNLGSIILDAGTDEFSQGDDSPAHNNGVAIGHGAMGYDDGGNQSELAVIDGAVNGIESRSTINVTAAQDITLQGGYGAVAQTTELGGSGTHAQIGHGSASALGDSRSSRGFNGDINVSAQGNILLRASDNGYLANAAEDLVYSSSGGAAFIGNGGINMDSGASGDITVYVGGDLDIIVPQRITENNPSLHGTVNDDGSSHFNFAKIGHVSTENQTSGVVEAGEMSGDIVVVVGNDLTMTGGRTPNHSSGNFVDDNFIDDIDDADLAGGTYEGLTGNQGVTGGFSQIGHGGPGINSIISGDIEVYVQNNFETRDGTTDLSDGSAGNLSPNNYVKIGHGDWLRDGNGAFRGSASGLASGNIVVAVGESADLENTFIGHVDPAVGSPMISGTGTTSFAVSRNYPFYTEVGGGTLTANGITDQADIDGSERLGGTGVGSGSVFTSGAFGSNPLRIYIPKRDSNFLLAGTSGSNIRGTRLNSASTLYHGNNGGGTPGPGVSGPYGGEDDEVFLAPDLWWMSDAAIDEANSRGYNLTSSASFPTSATSSNGMIAEVDDPGALPNITNLTSGALGSSPNGGDYRSHSLSGGDYTLFYDALEPVLETTFPAAPAGPAPDLAPLAFNEGLFDVYDRPKDGFNGIFGDYDGGLANLPEPDNGRQFNVPGQVMEEFLDMVFGPRTSGDSRVSSGGALEAVDPDAPGSRSSSEVGQEDLEELERQANQENRPPAVPGGVEAYIYVPGASNPYSSFSIFGDAE